MVTYSLLNQVSQKLWLARRVHQSCSDQCLTAFQITDETNIADAFAYMSVMYCIGESVG